MTYQYSTLQNIDANTRCLQMDMQSSIVDDRSPHQLETS